MAGCKNKASHRESRFYLKGWSGGWGRRRGRQTTKSAPLFLYLIAWRIGVPYMIFLRVTFTVATKPRESWLPANVYYGRIRRWTVRDTLNEVCTGLSAIRVNRRNVAKPLCLVIKVTVEGIVLPSVKGRALWINRLKNGGGALSSMWWKSHGGYLILISIERQVPNTWPNWAEFKNECKYLYV